MREIDRVAVACGLPEFRYYRFPAVSFAQFSLSSEAMSVGVKAYAIEAVSEDTTISASLAVQADVTALSGTSQRVTTEAVAAQAASIDLACSEADLSSDPLWDCALPGSEHSPSPPEHKPFGAPLMSRSGEPSHVAFALLDEVMILIKTTPYPARTSKWQGGASDDVAAGPDAQTLSVSEMVYAKTKLGDTPGRLPLLINLSHPRRRSLSAANVTLLAARRG